MVSSDSDAVRGAQTGNVNFFQKPHCSQISNMIYYAPSRHQETIGRKAGRTNRVEHHGGSREAMSPRGKHVPVRSHVLNASRATVRLRGVCPFLRRLTEQECMQTIKWAEHGRFCIEDAAILNDHSNSWIARYLLDQGFRDDTPNGYHRSGPWMWVDANGMTFRYHPRYGVGYGTPIADVSLTGADFKALWEIVSRRKQANADIRGGWEERIQAQKNYSKE